MNTVKILSLNCRGLRDFKKRKDVFRYLQDKKASIYCLQDTHLLRSDDNLIHAQWGHPFTLSPGFGLFNTRESTALSSGQIYW